MEERLRQLVMSDGGCDNAERVASRHGILDGRKNRNIMFLAALASRFHGKVKNTSKLDLSGSRQCGINPRVLFPKRAGAQNAYFEILRSSHLGLNLTDQLPGSVSADVASLRILHLYDN
jgi:hypothetical protein